MSETEIAEEVSRTEQEVQKYASDCMRALGREGLTVGATKTIAGNRIFAAAAARALNELTS